MRIALRSVLSLVTLLLAPSAGACSGSMGQNISADHDRPSSAAPRLVVGWPAPGSILSGIQNFSARVDGRPCYDVYWSADTGPAQEMPNSAFGRPGREATVDIERWRAHPYGSHRVTISAIDCSGAMIGYTELDVFGTRLTTTLPEGEPTEPLVTLRGELEGVPAALYHLYWRVDYGERTEMALSRTDSTAHEYLLSIANWNWRPSGKYVISIEATDLAGRVVTPPHSGTITVASGPRVTLN